ncbi:MAG TPA: lytic transglycosylase domain-containing protein [Magnetospirillaceae bacterium]|jgi:soluble lytic murein transglycosylase-like protein
MLKSRLLPTLVTIAFATAVPAFAQAASTEADRSHGDNMVAALTDGAALGRAGREIPVPTVLSASDVSAYQKALDLDAHGQWAASDREIAHLHNQILVGHILARRYLSDSYHPKAEELKTWLTRYQDFPETPDVYALAKKRLGKKFHPAGLATSSHAPDAAIDPDDADWTNFTIDSRAQRSPAEKNRIQSIKNGFRTKVANGKYDSAVDLLNAPESVRLLAPSDTDELKTVLAIALFDQGRDGDATYWAEQAAERSGDVLPEADWVAGLALWRQDQRADAAHHFEAVANAQGISNWLSSAGAFWAARANLAAKRPEVVNHWLQQAALYPRTFYGLLARRALGLDIQFSWDDRPFTDLDSDALLRIPGAVRAMALLQLGERSLAEDEMIGIAGGASPGLAQSLLAFARAADMPSLTVTLGRAVSSNDGRRHDAAFYPLPAWQPKGGWTVDRALVLAFARQESGFNPHAHSPAGAIGLMQLMPATARALGANGPLTDPDVSLQVGQHFLRQLITDDGIRGNLMLVAAAYNSGPTCAARWMQTIHHENDALLFMESIPTDETRVFVQRVLTNFWAYRSRLGRTSPSLDALAAGGWPLYDGTGSGVPSVKYVKD